MITCQYCSKIKQYDYRSCDSKNRGGTDTWENLVAACGKCNTKRKPPLDKIEMHLLKKPKKPNYLLF